MKLGDQFFQYYRDSKEQAKELKRLIENMEKANLKRLLVFGERLGERDIHVFSEISGIKKIPQSPHKKEES